jgi:prohibitin 1
MKKIFFIVITVLIFLFLLGCYYTVGAGKVGVKFNLVNGQASSNLQGIHFKLPIIESITKFSVRTQKLEVKAPSSSKDLQIVNVDAVLNYHLDYKKVDVLFVKVGKDYENIVILPAIFEAVKASISQYPVEQIIVNRDKVKQNIENNLKTKLINYNIILENVNLVNIDFTPEFNKIVEQKQIEEQKIKTAEYQRMQAEQYKQKTILEAEGEAQRQRLLQTSATKEIVELKWIDKWDGKLPETMFGNAANIMMNLKAKDKSLDK